MTVSAGTRSAGEINPVVVQAMKEIGMRSTTKVQGSRRRHDKKRCCKSKYGMHGRRSMSYTIHS